MNKKIIKILACSACGLGITTSIPFMATSCGSSNEWPENVVPKQAYNIDGDGKLIGWKQGWAEQIVKDGSKYNTMWIPDNVTEISQSAFRNTHGSYNIPLNMNLILNSKLKSIGEYAFDHTPLGSIDFSECVNLESIGNYAFTGDKLSEDDGDYSTFVEINLSSCTKLTYIGSYCFSTNLSLGYIAFPGSLNRIEEYIISSNGQSGRSIEIVWNNFDKTQSLDKNAFNLGESQDIDEGTVKSTGSIDSSTLLAFLKDRGLPNTNKWSVAE